MESESSWPVSGLDLGEKDERLRRLIPECYN